ncbi:MAG: sulfatase-like hydrolase/transferase [Anaerolineae bacterium]|nr:sulfatase-like hydrolase/transferase [Anaerolineae bacterium]
MVKNNGPHVVLLVLDTHRRDRLSLYNYHKNTSPNIDHFAESATVFENAISPAQWTIPAHASMFTGEYPTTHQTLQAHSMLDGRFDTLAKLLSANGYQTTGFCNNPLVGVLNNGLKRGFNKFYNYCGAVPSVPRRSNRLPSPINRLWEWYTQQLRKLSYPVQNAFAHSDFLFQASLHPRFVSLWSKLANFKGHTANSIRDVTELVQKMDTADKPQFFFFNLMETHLPYLPPDTFIDKFAPYFKEDRAYRDFLRRYNVETFRWLLPVEESLNEIENAVLNDVYDAEVNYQDHLLAQMLEFLSQADDILTIIVADHGEGIGEHNFLGHSFVAYQELVHVPLIIKFPEGMAAGQRIDETISTRRIFHTVLDAAHIHVPETEYRPGTDAQEMSLARTIQGRDPEEGLVFVEAYPPTTFLSMMEKRTPQLIEPFHCKRKRWGIYQDGYKMVKVEGLPEELYNVKTDPQETHNIADQKSELIATLTKKLSSFVQQAAERQPSSWQTKQTVNLDDEQMIKQLQALGYLE